MSFFIVALTTLLAFLAALFAARAKRTNDLLYGIAVREFHDSIERIMKTPDDLPDSVLLMLEVMNRSMLNPRSPRTLYRIITQGNAAKMEAAIRGTNKINISEMRPEITKLLARASVGWLGALRYRSLVMRVLIDHALRQKQVSQGKLISIRDEAEPAELYQYFNKFAA